MDKSIKIILFIIVALVVVNFAFTLFGNGGVRDIRNDLKNAKASTDSALNELRISQNKIDSIQSDIIVFRAYIKNIQQAVALADIKKSIEDETNKHILDSLKQRALTLKQHIVTDSIPPIEVRSVKK